MEEQGGYDEAFLVTEDYEMSLRMAKHYPIANLPRALYVQRIRPDSISGGRADEVLL